MKEGSTCKAITNTLFKILNTVEGLTTMYCADEGTYAQALFAMLRIGNHQIGKILFSIASASKMLSPALCESAVVLGVHSNDYEWANSAFFQLIHLKDGQVRAKMHP